MDVSQTVAAQIGRRCSNWEHVIASGLSGRPTSKFTHALTTAGIRYITARHEGNAAAMADAYSKATGELTLLSVHSGPGLTNALTGIGEAAKSRTPLVLAGDARFSAVHLAF